MQFFNAKQIQSLAKKLKKESDARKVKESTVSSKNNEENKGFIAKESPVYKQKRSRTTELSLPIKNETSEIIESVRRIQKEREKEKNRKKAEKRAKKLARERENRAKSNPQIVGMTKREMAEAKRIREIHEAAINLSISNGELTSGISLPLKAMYKCGRK